MHKIYYCITLAVLTRFMNRISSPFKLTREVKKRSNGSLKNVVKSHFLRENLELNSPISPKNNMRGK